MSFMEAIQSVFSQYAGFSGRARRSEYWYFTLFTIVVDVVLTFIGALLDSRSLGPILNGIFSLAILVPTLALTVRRLHDIGRSGFWIFIEFIPLVGEIILLVWTLQDSQPGTNEYGPNPKGVW